MEDKMAKKPTKKMSKITFVRLCLSGAIAGTAIVGVVAPVFGIDTTHMKDVIGGLIGASTVAIGFKIAHLV